MNKQIQLKGRIIITFDIEAVTGLHIGGSDAGIEIGGVDKTVIRDPLTNQPYIPGSSLKGKMRSLLEKYKGLKQNQRIGMGYIHSCGAEYKGEDSAQKGRADYIKCDVCQIFGVPGERDFSSPTRLVVRDTHLSAASAKDLNDSGRTVLPYTEVKTEVSIDRVTSAANPRQMERVPAGTVFGGKRKASGAEQQVDQPAEIVYSLYDGDDCDLQRDIERLRVLVEGMQLLDDDYLGGQGSRGSGKVRLFNIRLALRCGEPYPDKPEYLNAGNAYPDLQSFAAAIPELQREIAHKIPASK